MQRHALSCERASRCESISHRVTVRRGKVCQVVLSFGFAWADNSVMLLQRGSIAVRKHHQAWRDKVG